MPQAAVTGLVREREGRWVAPWCQFYRYGDSSGRRIVSDPQMKVDGGWSVYEPLSSGLSNLGGKSM